MQLFIDTSSNQKTIIWLGEKETVKDSSVWRSQVVLPMIKELLDMQDLTLQDITEIEVATGPGSFTGLRVGVAIANALGFALQIPVNGKLISGKQVVLPTY